MLLGYEDMKEETKNIQYFYLLKRLIEFCGA